MLFRNEKDKKDDKEQTGGPARVPLLPLRDIIVFPHMVVPLFVGRQRSIKALEEADVVILMIDAVEGIESQDINIFHLAEKNKKGVVIVVNKWDLIEKNKFRPVIDRKYPLEKIAEAYTYVASGQKIGNVIITMGA